MTKRSRTKQRQRRQIRVRKRVQGTADRPRLAVHRSNRHIAVQLINDTEGHTLASASTLEADLKTGTTSNAVAAAEVGKRIAERAKSAGVEAVVFDRGGNKYHGRVAALADAAREAGLDF